MKVKKLLRKHKTDVLRYAVTLKSPPGPHQMTWKTFVTAANAYQAGRLARELFYSKRDEAKQVVLSDWRVHLVEPIARR